MPNTTKQYTTDELWGVYDKLPSELQQTIFSGETADQIFATCDRNGVQEVSKVAYNVGLVLLGVLLPNQLENTLVQELKLKKQAAQAVMADINRFVFYPVKAQLEQIHQVPGETPQEQKANDLGVPTPRHSDRAKIAQQAEPPNGYMVQDESTQEESLVEEPKTKETDPYRETTE